MRLKCQVLVSTVTLHPPLCQYIFLSVSLHTHTYRFWKKISVSQQTYSHKTRSHNKVAMAICALRKIPYREENRSGSTACRENESFIRGRHQGLISSWLLSFSMGHSVFSSWRDEKATDVIGFEAALCFTPTAFH